jgi:ribosomal protein S18 acetylase RimI-like enzyme
VTPGPVERAAELGVLLHFGGVELVDTVEPLWLSLFDHHLAIGSAGLPVVDRGESWPRRKALYESLLAKPDAFLLLATRDEEPIAYLVAHLHEGADDTWPTGERIGEIESLALVPGERGAGLGGLLMDAAEERLTEVGARDVLLHVMVGNDDARRFYESRGMTATMTTMLRLGVQDP